MAVIKAQCPACAKAFGVLEHQLGHDVYCPHCGAKVRLPAPRREAADVRAEAAAQFMQPSGQEFPSVEPKPATRKGPASREAEAERALEEALGIPGVPGHAQAKPLHGMPPHVHHSASSSALSQIATARAQRTQSTFLAWGIIILVLLLGLGLGYVLLGGRFRETRGPLIQTSEEARRQAYQGLQPTTGRSTPLPPLTGQPPIVGPNERPVTEEQPVPEEAVNADKPPMMFKKEAELFYDAKPGETIFVIIGSVENFTDDLIRVATISLSAIDAASGEPYASKAFVFRDLAPKEKAYLAFEYPYIKDRDVKLGHSSLGWEFGTRPEHQFEVTTATPKPDGARSGLITGTIANKSREAAPVVDLFFLLRDARKEPSGYAIGQVRNMAPASTQEFKFRWENWLKDGVQYADCRAQIGSE